MAAFGPSESDAGGGCYAAARLEDPVL